MTSPAEESLTEEERFILEAFEENYERLRQETGNALTPDTLAAAREQVLNYWRKMRGVAENVTETEVRLTLPEQCSPKGRRFTLEGVVDIVSEDGRTVMYDLKTHLDAEAAAADLEPYVAQLNLYAHIWHNLRGQPLDATAIIASSPSSAMRHAARTGDPRLLQKAFDEWSPVIEIPLDPRQVNDVVTTFGEVVDAIEERRFAPPKVDVLLTPQKSNRRRAFGTDVCINCDARFSCDSYRHFATQQKRGLRPDAYVRYSFEDYGSDGDRAGWLDANLTTLDRAVNRDEPF